MMLRRSFALAGVSGLLSTSLFSAGCNGSSGAKTASVTPADMPEGGDWTGVYFDQFYGYFHLVQDGKAVNGKWIRPQKDRWGELHGDATGNVLKFTWTEYTIGAIGKNAEKSGRGYMVYSRPAGENVDDKVNGELGRGNDEVGEKLEGVKQRNQNPDLGSIGGTGATDITGGDWDGDSKESSPPEEPKSGPTPGN